ncbi:molecular chaperone Tir [Empedobacter falsenii]|uniref:molecular chaperone Tir n=1 Tax=Empedobacter falsenii TaxID=343874 RepID=UPI0025756549|nr:molecular chaperone Tir [Empedobacter falsenii]MDM1299829.1 molecular chaperone Tir [Empedobacter falsenii]MDM1319622.1 molecular chaperone Tir [Empedobacter falsenii]
MNYFSKIENFIQNINYTITYKDEKEGVFMIENLLDGVQNLIVGIAPPVIIFELYLFTITNDNLEMLKALLMKNRDIIHGAFAITEDGNKVIYRYTLQIANLDQNEFEATLNSLSLLMSEYSAQLIEFSKQ